MKRASEVRRTWNALWMWAELPVGMAYTGIAYHGMPLIFTHTEGAFPCASANRRGRGVNSAAAPSAGIAPLRFPSEPSGGVLEKLEPENSRGSAK